METYGKYGSSSTTKHTNATSYIIQFQGYTGQTWTVGGFSSNMTRASQQAHSDPEAEKSVDKPAQQVVYFSIKTANPYYTYAKHLNCLKMEIWYTTFDV